MRIPTFLLLVATGLGMMLPGIYLALLGGSLYYAVAGYLILVKIFFKFICLFNIFNRQFYYFP